MSMFHKCTRGVPDGSWLEGCLDAEKQQKVEADNVIGAINDAIESRFNKKKRRIEAVARRKKKFPHPFKK
jgi:hypothetical protein